VVDILGYTTLSRPFPLFPLSVLPGVRQSPFYLRLAAMTWSVSEIQPGAPTKNQPTPRFPHKATYISLEIPLLSLSTHCLWKPSQSRTISASSTKRSAIMNLTNTPIGSPASFKIPPRRAGRSDRRSSSPRPRSILLEHHELYSFHLLDIVWWPIFFGRPED
jgi:hypothetical protein